MELRSQSLQCFRRAVGPCLLALFLLGLSACTTRPEPSAQGCATSPFPCLSGTALVSLETNQGKVILELDGDAAPLTAGNFIDLVKKEAYDGTAFHRVVRDPVPFVVQGGDPLSANPKISADRYGSGNFIDPSTGEARLIPLELKLKSDQEPTYGQVITSPLATEQLSMNH